MSRSVWLVDVASTLALLLKSKSPRLDEIAEVIERLSDEPTRPGTITAELDRLASEYQGKYPEPTVETLLHFIFSTEHFRPNPDDYYSPNNSFLGSVLCKRKGIPISLSLVSIEVGRRVGVTLTPVGMPGHFLIGDGLEPTRWFDPFERGAELDIDGCEAIFNSLNKTAFSPQYVRAIPNPHVAARMLSNLRIAFTTEGNVNRLIATLECVVALPIARNEDRHQLATMLASLGRCDLAAAVHESLAALDPAAAELHLERAALLKNRRN